MVDDSKYYIFYDGDCGFCDYWVHWILKRDHNDYFRFASLQSEFGQNFLVERGLKSSDFDTMILWKPSSFYLTKSEAIFSILNILGGVYKILSFAQYLPKFLSDSVYSFIASKRKSIKMKNCELPTEQERKKFVK